LVSTFQLSARLGQLIRQQRMLYHLGIEMWINLQQIRYAAFVLIQSRQKGSSN
jgi:hypothetical protein